MTDVSIVVVNWNTRDVLLNCLASVYAQTQGIDFELILVDNASSDGSAEMVREEFPQVILIANSENRGFAAANNQGMQIAQGRYVLLLNPDTIVLDQAIPKTIAFADRNMDIAVVGCQVWLNETEIQQTCFSFPSLSSIFFKETGLRRLFPKSRIFGKADYGWWDRKSQMDVDVVSGMYMLVRRDAIKQVGLMDEDYFVYAEEADWCSRFWKAGWRCVFIPGARIIHLDGGGKSTAQTSTKMFVQHQKSLLLFFKKQQGVISWVAVKFLLIFSMSFRYVVFFALGLIKRDEYYSTKANQSLAVLRFGISGNEPK